MKLKQKYITAKELAENLGIGHKSVLKQIERGKFKGRLKKCPCGQAWLIRVDEFS